MKTIISVFILIFSYQLLSAQKLEHQGKEFLYNSKIYSINEIGKLLVLNSEEQGLFEEIKSLDNFRKTWQFVTIGGLVSFCSGIAGIMYFQNHENQFINLEGQILSSMIVIVSIPVTLVSTIGLLITISNRNHKIDSFVDKYNNSITNINNSKIDFKISSSGIGFIMTF